MRSAVRQNRRLVMTENQFKKATRFRALHTTPALSLSQILGWGDGAHLRGPWLQSARHLQRRPRGDARAPDGASRVMRAMAHCRVIVESTALPVAADLEEKGFMTTQKRSPRRSPSGRVLGSLADPLKIQRAISRGHCSADEAVERVSAAVERHGHWHSPSRSRRGRRTFPGHRTSRNTIRRSSVREGWRGRAVRFALPDWIGRAICKAVSEPVNFMVGVLGSHSPSRISPRPESNGQPGRLGAPRAMTGCWQPRGVATGALLLRGQLGVWPGDKFLPAGVSSQVLP